MVKNMVRRKSAPTLAAVSENTANVPSSSSSCASCASRASTCTCRNDSRGSSCNNCFRAPACTTHSSHTADVTADEAQRRKFQTRLRAFYWAHDPRQVDNVDAILDRNKGHEEALLQRVHMQVGARDFSGEVAIDDLYEHERYSYFSFSYGSSLPGHLLPTDRHRWGSMFGTPSSQTRAHVEPQLPVNWIWTTEWVVDTHTGNCDADGWTYGFDFTLLNSALKRSGGRREPRATDYVRRRRWIRHRQRVVDVVEVTEPVQTDDSDTNEAAASVDRIDVAPNDLNVDDNDDNDDNSDDNSDDEDDEASALDASIAFSTAQTLDPKAFDAAWASVVVEMEHIYTRAIALEVHNRKRWRIEQAKLQRQIALLEKAIAALATVASTKPKQQHASSTNSSPRSLLPASTLSPRVAAAKSQRAQAKLDSLKRQLWHPRATFYTLRFSIDGIFYGLRTFAIETLASSFAVHVSHQTNGASGIAPSMKVSMRGHTVCAGEHVKVTGDRGTRVPKSVWDRMYLDTDFDVTLHLIYVEDVPQTGSFARSSYGRWEFLLTPDATRVDLSNFTRRVQGGLDLPEAVVRKLCADVLTALLRDVALLYVPPELATAFAVPPAKLDVEGSVKLTGIAIDDVWERPIEQIHDVSSTSDADADAVTPTLLLAQARLPQSRRQTDAAMRRIAATLKLTPAQFNLLVALKDAPLFPAASSSFRTIANMCAYYTRFFVHAAQSPAPTDENDSKSNDDAHATHLRALWRRALELVYVRKLRAANVSGSGAASAVRIEALPFALFEIDALFATLARLANRPVTVELCVTRVHCVVSAQRAVDAAAKLLERVVVGVDVAKPRTGFNAFLYGFRFGRKTSKPIAALAAGATTATAATCDKTNAVTAATSSLDAAFRSKLESVRRVVDSLLAALAVVTHNVESVSVAVAAKLRGNGTDCDVNGSIHDVAFVGPVSVQLAVPACLFGLYRIETVSDTNKSVGLQIELLVPKADAGATSPLTNRTQRRRASQQQQQRRSHHHPPALEAVGRVVVTDVVSKVLIDVDALVEHHQQQQRQHSASIASVESTAQTAPTSKLAHKPAIGEKHCALAFSFGAASSTPDGNKTAHNRVDVRASAFTKLHASVGAGSFVARVVPIVHWVVATIVRPLVQQHASNDNRRKYETWLDAGLAALLAWLSSASLTLDVDVLVRAFKKTNNNDDSDLVLTLSGGSGVVVAPLDAAAAPPPPAVVYKDELLLLPLILQLDDVVSEWIDDQYPPYANPLYF